MRNHAVERVRGKLALVNGRIALPDEIVTGKALLVEGKKIVGVVDRDAITAETRRLDVNGRLITPGLVDIHTHGALGYTFNDASGEAFAAITREQVQHGVSSILATTTTASIPSLVDSIEFTRRWMQEPQKGAQILGVHLEGPYFCPTERGAQDLSHLRTPNDGSPDKLLEHRDVIKIISFAPELPGGLDLTKKIANAGIVPAAGHSCARENDVLAAMENGLSHIIHIWSGQSSTIREGPWRRPGLLETALALDGLTVEMIADNRHLPATLMKLAYKCIGPDSLCVISDATSGAGLPEKARFYMGGVACEVHDGVGMLLDHTQFAGSITLLNQMIPVLAGVVGIPLAQAIRMATLTPAKVIGVDQLKGSLKAGKDADLAVFTEDFTAWRTMIAGQWVW